VTPADARTELQRPLVFGKPEQIQAVQVLEAVERCVAAILGCTHNHAERAKCSNCRGSGRCTCFDCDHSHDCGQCHGEGRRDIRCKCYAGFTEEILRAALKSSQISRELQEKIEELACP